MSKTPADRYTPVVICNCKNDMVYLRELLPYYRNIGIKEFAFIDNGSTDGSIDYLKEQPDVRLFSADAAFEGTRKVGWRLKVIDRLGLDRWYLLLDSDEFLTYPEMDRYAMDEYVAALHAAGYTKMKTFVLDMYPQYGYFNDTKADEDFMKDYRFFDGYDPARYFWREWTTGHMRKEKVLLGGIRFRTMQTTPRLDETRLMYVTKGQFPCGNHDVFYEDGFGEPLFGGILRHYKFLPSDKKKYRDLTKKGGGGYSDSASLQRYLQYAEEDENGENPLIFDGTREFSHPADVMEFPFIRSVFENETA